MRKPTRKQIVSELRRQAKTAHEEMAGHAADLIEKQAARISQLESELLEVRRTKSIDTERLDYLDKNMFHREKDEWDSKWAPNSTMWVTFAPTGVQGSSRNIIDAAMTRVEQTTKLLGESE